MRRLDDLCRTCDRSVVAGGRIILPCAFARLILPLAHGHVLQVRRQCNLRRTGGRRPGSVFEYLLAADPCAARIFARLDQRDGYVGGRVDRQSVVRIGIRHIRNIGDQSAGDAAELIAVHRKDIAAHGFIRRQRGFTAAAFLALPRDGQRGIRKRNRRLIGVDDRRYDQFSLRRAPVRGIGAGIGVVDLCPRLIAAQVDALRFAVRQVDDCLAACCDDCHVIASLFIYKQTSSVSE